MVELIGSDNNYNRDNNNDNYMNGNENENKNALCWSAFVDLILECFSSAFVQCCSTSVQLRIH